MKFDRNNYFIKISQAIFILFLMVLFYDNARGQVVINEGSNKNYSSISDENGDYPDWIEIYNAGTDTIHLQGYSLTDDMGQPFKWTFPDIKLLPGQYKVVFCSGKNRKPTAGFVNVLSETGYNPTTGWNNHNLATPVYWDGTSSLLLNVCSYRNGYITNSVFNQTVTPYYSTVFAFQDGSPYICQSEYGFKATQRPNIKINNNIIGTGTQQNSPFDYPAPYGNWYWAARHQMILPAAELLSSGLTPGLITSLAFDVASTDPAIVYDYINFSIKPVSYNEVTTSFEPLDTNLTLHTNFKISTSGETVYLFDSLQSLVSSLLINCEQPDNSVGLFPDAGSNTAIFLTGTPEATNNNSQTYSTYLLAPVITTPSGIYSSPINVSINNPNGSGSVIRYTLDGSDPDTTAAVYNGTPIPVFFSGVLKARAFSTTELPSQEAVSSYLFGITHVTPILSVVTDPENLYGPDGIFDNWQFDWEKAAYAEYFDTLNQLVFSQRAGIQIDGGLGGSRSHPQHSFRVELDDPVLGSGPVYYPIIPNRSTRIKYSKIYLRNGSNYYQILPYKDAAHLEGMAAETYNYYSAWRPVTVYINGGYFGIYELREKFDSEYFEEIEGADGDSLDLLSLSAWNGYVLRALEGSVDSFFVDHADFSNLTPTDSAFLTDADQYFDLQYYADYIIAETWAGNVDWPQNNIKIYRSNTTGFRWRFCVIDLEGSMDPFGFSTAQDDHIAYVLNADPNNPYINIFLKCIQNTRFRNYFINRYADLMNTSYKYQRLSSVANNMFNQTVIEMPKQYMRWGDPNNITGQMNGFVSNHQTFLSELSIRTDIVRNHIQNNFALNGQEEVTLNVLPAGAGKITISTITPDTLPWTGIYFDGNPFRITALPNPGYNFEYWEINSGGNITLDTNISIVQNVSSATTFTAIFSNITTGTSIAETKRSEWIVYPNPSGSVFNFYLTKPLLQKQKMLVEVYNYQGSKILSSEIHDSQKGGAIDLSGYAKGVYLAKLVVSDQEVYTRKLILE